MAELRSAPARTQRIECAVPYRHRIALAGRRDIDNRLGDQFRFY
jgi:hypothetical protein